MASSGKRPNVANNESQVISSPFSLDEWGPAPDQRGVNVPTERVYEPTSPQSFWSGAPFSTGIPFFGRDYSRRLQKPQRDDMWSEEWKRSKDKGGTADEQEERAKKAYFARWDAEEKAINLPNSVVRTSHPDRFDRFRKAYLEDWKDTGVTLGGLMLAAAPFASGGGKPSDLIFRGKLAGGVGGAALGAAGDFVVDAVSEKSDEQRIQRIQEYALKKYGIPVSVEEAQKYLARTGDLYENPEVGAFYGMNIPGLGFKGTRTTMSTLSNIMNPFAQFGGRFIGNKQMDIGYDATDEMIADRVNSNRTREGMRAHVLRMYGNPETGYGGLSVAQIREKFPDLFADEGDAKYPSPRSMKSNYAPAPSPLPKDIPLLQQTPNNL